MRGEDLAETLTEKQKEIMDRYPDIDEVRDVKEQEKDGGSEMDEIQESLKAIDEMELYNYLRLLRTFFSRYEL